MVKIYNLQGDVVALIDANGTNPFRYRGYVYDEETGLYYLRSRVYNPEWKRFMNADVSLENADERYAHNPSLTECNLQKENY